LSPGRSDVLLPLQKDTLRRRLRRSAQYAGPGLLVSVGYMDPGNWATDIEAGSRFGYGLLFVVLLSSLAAMLLQTLCVRLGLVASRDLAQMCRDRYDRKTTVVLWLGAEIAIIACDLAEVIGSALALHLLFGMSLMSGILLTAFDTLLVLALQGTGMKRIEALVLALVLTVAGCFAVELVMAQPNWLGVTIGFVPSLERLHQTDALYLAIGIVGATVMPHNLYLHTAVIQRRRAVPTEVAKRGAILGGTVDAVVSLSLALMVNAAIMIVAASAFHATGQPAVTGIDEAYRLLGPILGTWAPILFGVALLASGQSSTLTGTLAGQVVIEGFLKITMPLWQRRLLTRSLALGPAMFGVAWFGPEGDVVNRMLVLSQVVLSFQLPFAIYPLIRFTSNRDVMGRFANGYVMRCVAWMIFGVIVLANVWLLCGFAGRVSR
jgi:manganese transport protein